MGLFTAKLKLLTRSRILALVLGIIIAVVGAWTIKTYRHRFIPHRFYVVEAGGIYRGARQTPSITRKIIVKNQIRTIVNLDDRTVRQEDADPPSHAEDRYAEEKAIAEDLGLQYHGFLWKGSGIGGFEEYDAVADILATTSCRPVFVHCAAGEKRTNAALAAYWIRHRGYTLEQTIEGLKRYGLNPEKQTEFVTHLRDYYEYTKQHPRPPARVANP